MGKKHIRNVLLAAAFGLSVGMLYTSCGSGISTPKSDTLNGGPSYSDAADTPSVRLLRSDEHGVVLELLTPSFRIVQENVERKLYSRLEVNGYGTTDTPGHTRLPVKGTMVGIPTWAEVTLNVLDTETYMLADRYFLSTVPSPILEMEPSADFQYQSMALTYEEEAYSQDYFLPTPAAELVATGFIGSQRVAVVRFHPFQYNPSSGELLHLRSILVRLDFNQENTQSHMSNTTVGERPFESLLQDSLLNYKTAKEWRFGPQPSTPYGITAFQNQSGYKIKVADDGIYQVTYADLQAVGIPVDSLDPKTFQCYNQGSEIAIYVAGESDNSFDPGDHILFYGQKITTRFTDINIYWLKWGEAIGLRMSTIDGSPGGTGTVPTFFHTTLRVEDDQLYRSDLTSGPDNDHWYWKFVLAASPTSVDHSAIVKYPYLPQPPEPISATVRGLFNGYDASPQHHTYVYINGYYIDDAYWASQDEYTFEVDIPQSYLVEGSNTITVETPLDSGITLESFFINWFEIDYYREYSAEDDILFFDGDVAGTWEYQLKSFTTNALEAFDITIPSNPIRILNTDISIDESAYRLTFEHSITTEHHYVAMSTAQRLSPLSIEQDNASNLRAAVNGADYIIITHDDFSASLQPLITHRTAQGLRTVLVDVEDVYDEFSHGVFYPEALRDFLSYTYASWTPPAPSYVLLVGDGHYDFKDILGRGEPNFIPPFLAYVDPWMGEVPADNRYVCIVGSDNLPDMYIGRLPVKTVAETDEMVSKILNYEQSPPGGDWNLKVLLIADNSPDPAGDFYNFADSIAENYLPTPYMSDKIYYGLTHATQASAKSAIIDAINEGRLLVSYIGHSTVQFWAGEKLFEIGDIDSLSNDGWLPFMVPMTCLDGYFINPSPAGNDLSSLGESIARATGGGAIASWSPTGLGVLAGHDFLNQGLYDAIFVDYISQLGAATTKAKLHLYQNTGGYRDLIDTYVLFGDPALELNTLTPPSGNEDGDGGRCFIATAAYGSSMKSPVKLLHAFRDRFLLSNTWGTNFVQIYYTYSPTISEFIAKHNSLRAIVRVILLPFVGFSWVALKLGFVSTISLIILFCIGIFGLSKVKIKILMLTKTGRHR